jgi:hypothetical protein
MPITEQLVVRAHRILTDGRRHTPAALLWAHRTVAKPIDRRTQLSRLRGFTLRELSLGAERW